MGTTADQLQQSVDTSCPGEDLTACLLFVMEDRRSDSLQSLVEVVLGRAEGSVGDTIFSKDLFTSFRRSPAKEAPHCEWMVHLPRLQRENRP